MKSQSPRFSPGLGDGGQRLQMTSILLSLFQKIRNMNFVWGIPISPFNIQFKPFCRTAMGSFGHNYQHLKIMQFSVKEKQYLAFSNQRTCTVPSSMWPAFEYVAWSNCKYRCMLTLGGNVYRILLQNEPIFTKCQEKTPNEGRQIWKFSYLIIFSVLDRWYFRPTVPILRTLNTGWCQTL